MSGNRVEASRVGPAKTEAVAKSKKKPVKAAVKKTTKKTTAKAKKA